MDAHYICAILNSNVINDNIKPLQPRGLFGERAVTRRPFLFPIPCFNDKNLAHTQLAKLSKLCHDKLSLKLKKFEEASGSSSKERSKRHLNRGNQKD